MHEWSNCEKSAAWVGYEFTHGYQIRTCPAWDLSAKSSLRASQSIRWRTRSTNALFVPTYGLESHRGRKLFTGASVLQMTRMCTRRIDYQSGPICSWINALDILDKNSGLVFSYAERFHSKLALPYGSKPSRTIVSFAVVSLFVHLPPNSNACILARYLQSTQEMFFLISSWLLRIITVAGFISQIFTPLINAREPPEVQSCIVIGMLLLFKNYWI